MLCAMCAGVVAMFGSTYTGQYEDVEAFDAKVGEWCCHAQHGCIHSS